MFNTVLVKVQPVQESLHCQSVGLAKTERTIDDLIAK